MADVQVMSLAARPEPEGGSGCKVWETAGGPSDVQTRIAIVGVSLGTVLFASVSNVGRWLSLLAGPTVLTAYIRTLEKLCEENPRSVDLRTCLGMAYAVRR